MVKDNRLTIAEDTAFIQMVKKRNRFALILSFLVLLTYALFMGVATFNPQLLAAYMGDSHITWGMPLSALVIIISWLITGWYIYVTNQYFDKQKAALKKAYHYE